MLPSTSLQIAPNILHYGKRHRHLVHIEILNGPVHGIDVAGKNLTDSPMIPRLRPMYGGMGFLGRLHFNSEKPPLDQSESPPTSPRLKSRNALPTEQNKFQTEIAPKPPFPIFANTFASIKHIASFLY